MLNRYFCCDDADPTTHVVIEASTQEAALDEYIARALENPDAYDQGVSGTDNRFLATCWPDDADDEWANNARLEKLIVFPLPIDPVFFMLETIGDAIGKLTDFYPHRSDQASIYGAMSENEADHVDEAEHLLNAAYDLMEKVVDSMSDRAPDEQADA